MKIGWHKEIVKNLTEKVDGAVNGGRRENRRYSLNFKGGGLLFMRALNSGKGLLLNIIIKYSLTKKKRETL